MVTMAVGVALAGGCGSGDTAATNGSGGATAAGAGGTGGGAGAGASGAGGAATGGAPIAGSGGAPVAGSGGVVVPDAGQGGSGGTGGSGGSGGASADGAAAGSGGTPNTGGTGGSGGTHADGGTDACGSASLGYDQLILCDGPVAYWAMTELSGSEPDLTGNAHTGSHQGGAAKAAITPNGDRAADFDGSSQYVTVPSSPAFSIPTTGNLTWEAWIRPDILQFPNDSGGYVDWMGKCADYSPTCEWEARMYDTTNPENRCNRFSAYVFNPSAGLGSGADWQPVCGLIQAAEWYHVVGEYTLETEPSDCANATTYPGSIDIWVNGVEWNHGSHGQTGCLSQYNVIPEANDSPLNIGTMAGDAWFQGAIAKVAIYDHLLTAAEISAHYQAMTGQAPTGSCASSCSF
jgi:Concanavalin A-like lectin/glucanases superfamily